MESFFTTEILSALLILAFFRNRFGNRQHSFRVDHRSKIISQKPEKSHWNRIGHCDDSSAGLIAGYFSSDAYASHMVRTKQQYYVYLNLRPSSNPFFGRAVLIIQKHKGNL